MKLPKNATTKLFRIYVKQDGKKLNLYDIRKKTFKAEAGYFWSKEALATQYLNECIAKGIPAQMECITQATWIKQDLKDRKMKAKAAEALAKAKEKAKAEEAAKNAVQAEPVDPAFNIFASGVEWDGSVVEVAPKRKRAPRKAKFTNDFAQGVEWAA